MPVWALERIIAKMGDARPALAELAAVGGCDVVRLPDVPPGCRDALMAVLEAQAHLGQLALEASYAVSPHSDGGTALTPGERLRLRERLAPLRQLILELDAELQR